MAQENTRAEAVSRALQQANDLMRDGNLAFAERFCQDALKLDKTNFQALLLQGTLAARQGRHEEAVAHLRKALRRRPDSAVAHCHMGRSLHLLGRLEDAIGSFRRAIALDKDLADAHSGLAALLAVLHRYEEASAGFLKSLELRRDTLARQPNDALAQYRLCGDFARLEMLEEALQCARSAVSIEPDFTNARGALAMLQLPSVHASAQSAGESRIAFARELTLLDEWLEKRRPDDGYTAFASPRVCYLAYQEENNVELLSRYGDLCTRTLARWKEAQGFTARPRGPRERIRVGIALADVRDHSVWNALVRGWLEFCDPARFEFVVFQLERRQDRETEFARSRARLLDVADPDLRQTVQAILEESPDVLIYPEIGLSSKASVLAGLRLAPVQATSWGHPETSGLPTMDCFLSAEALEPPGAQEHYREKLVTLPNLGCCHRLPEGAGVLPDLSRLGIAADRPLLICAGTPFKYAPQFDRVLVEIAQRLGRCQLIFFGYAQWIMVKRLRSRLESAFTHAGLALKDHVVIVPWLDRPHFRGLLQCAQVYLDTIGFSGFNTAIEALHCDLPVVTREGHFMRGRLASGVLRHIGVPELVAATEEAYVELAIRLVQNADFHRGIVERIAQSRRLLAGDLSPIRALEEWISGSVAAQ